MGFRGDDPSPDPGSGAFSRESSQGDSSWLFPWDSAPGSGSGPLGILPLPSPSPAQAINSRRFSIPERHQPLIPAPGLSRLIPPQIPANPDREQGMKTTGQGGQGQGEPSQISRGLGAFPDFPQALGLLAGARGGSEGLEWDFWDGWDQQLPGKGDWIHSPFPSCIPTPHPLPHPVSQIPHPYPHSCPASPPQIPIP